MENIGAIVTRVGTAVLMIINALSGAGVVLPDYVSAEGVNVLSVAALAVASAVIYFTKKPAPAPVEPVA
jgi:hypothetical protein